jgi:hypothetical protein
MPGVIRRSLLIVPLLAVLALFLSAASAALALAPAPIVFQGRRGNPHPSWGR